MKIKDRKKNTDRTSNSNPIEDLLALKQNAAKLDDMRNSQDPTYLHFLNKIKNIIRKINEGQNKISLVLDENFFYITLRLFINDNEIVFERDSLQEEFEESGSIDFTSEDITLLIPKSSIKLGSGTINDAGKPCFK